MLSGLPTSFEDSFPSEYLGRLVKLKVSGDDSEGDTVFVCLDESLGSLASASKVPGASFVSLESQTSSFRLSLASLEAYSAFLALELLPFLQRLWEEQTRVVLVGQQFSGVVGVYTAVYFPTFFLGALCVSGSFWWKPEGDSGWEWLSKWLAKQSAYPGRVFLICSKGAALDRPRGVPTTLMANRHLKDVLTAKSCQVELLESLKSEFSTNFLAEFTDAVRWFMKKPV